MKLKQPSPVLALIIGVVLGLLVAAAASAAAAWSITSTVESPITGVIAGFAALAIALASAFVAFRAPVTGAFAGLTLAILGLVCLASPLSGLTAPTDLWSLLQVGGRTLVVPSIGGGLLAIAAAPLIRSRSHRAAESQVGVGDSQDAR